MSRTLGPFAQRVFSGWTWLVLCRGRLNLHVVKNDFSLFVVFFFVKWQVTIYFLSIAKDQSCEK